MIAAAQQYSISGEDIMRATGESPLSTYSPDSNPSNFALAQALESIPTTIDTGVQYNPQTRDVDQGVAAQSDFSVVNPRTGQLENVEPASNYIPGAPANQFVVSSGQGVFEQGDKRFQPVNLVTVDASGNVTPSGTFNIEKNELSDFAQVVGGATKAAAIIGSAYAIGSSLLEAAGLGNTAAGTAAAEGAVLEGATSSFAPGSLQATLAELGVAPTAGASAVPGSLQAFLPELGVTPLIQGGAAAGTASLFTPAVTPPVTPAPPSAPPPAAPPPVTPPPPPPGTPPTQTVTVTAPRPPVVPPAGVPPILPLPIITPPPAGGPLMSTNNGPTSDLNNLTDPNMPTWLTQLLGITGSADSLLSSASPLLSALSSNEAAKNTIEALRNQGALAKEEYRSLADEASRDVSFTPYGVSTGLFSTTRPTTTGVFESTLNPQTQALVDAANAASLGSFQQAGTADLNQMAADRMALYQQLVSPEQQRNRLAQEARLQAQGRLGVGAGGGEYAPELRALEDAIAKQNLQFALAAPQEALAQRASLISQGQAAGQLPLGISQQQLSALQLGGQLGQQQAQTAYQRGGLLGQLAGTGISENLMAQLAAAQVQAERDKALATAFSGMSNRSGGSSGGLFTDLVNFGRNIYNTGASIIG
jgi:hypothetical protein